MSHVDSDKIRELNDTFRRTFIGGHVVLTAGIAARDNRTAILAKVRAFESFDTGNDPHGEHDFGAFDHDGERIFWKIDYYDEALRLASSDPSGPALTARVLTVMLAQEY